METTTSPWVQFRANFWPLGPLFCPSPPSLVPERALDSWKLNIVKIIDGRISFYCNDLDLLPPKPKFTFRHFKKGIQEFLNRFVLGPADKAANNVVVVCHSVLPHPFQNIVLHLLKHKQTTTPAIINIETLRETVSQVYSLSLAILLSWLPSRNSQTNVF